MGKKLIILLIGIFFITSAFAQISIGNQKGGVILNDPDDIPVINVNVSGSDFFWRLDGSNAPPSADWDMGGFDFNNVGTIGFDSSTGAITGAVLGITYSGEVHTFNGNIINMGNQIDPSVAFSLRGFGDIGIIQYSSTDDEFHLNSIAGLEIGGYLEMENNAIFLRTISDSQSIVSNSATSFSIGGVDQHMIVITNETEFASGTASLDDDILLTFAKLSDNPGNLTYDASEGTMVHNFNKSHFTGDVEVNEGRMNVFSLSDEANNPPVSFVINETERIDPPRYYEFIINRNWSDSGILSNPAINFEFNDDTNLTSGLFDLWSLFGLTLNRPSTFRSQMSLGGSITAFLIQITDDGLYTGTSTGEYNGLRFAGLTSPRLNPSTGGDSEGTMNYFDVTNDFVPRNAGAGDAYSIESVINYHPDTANTATDFVDFAMMRHDIAMIDIAQKRTHYGLYWGGTYSNFGGGTMESYPLWIEKVGDVTDIVFNNNETKIRFDNEANITWDSLNTIGIENNLNIVNNLIVGNDLNITNDLNFGGELNGCGTDLVLANGSCIAYPAASGQENYIAIEMTSSSNSEDMVFPFASTNYSTFTNVTHAENGWTWHGSLGFFESPATAVYRITLDIRGALPSSNLVGDVTFYLDGIGFMTRSEDAINSAGTEEFNGHFTVIKEIDAGSNLSFSLDSSGACVGPCDEIVSADTTVSISKA